MKRVISVSIAIVIMAGLIVGYYFFLSKNGPTNKKKDTKVTEYSKIVAKDLVKDYPKTPRKVVMTYNQIITEYYRTSHKDNEIEKMADQARLLFDDELLKQNPTSTYYANVKADIQDYAKRKAKILQTKVVGSGNVEYATYQGYDVAFVESYYFCKEGSDIVRTYQKFCLRKDKSGKWKILTWELVDGDPELFD